MPKTKRQLQLERLKKKVNALGLGGSFWKPPQGTTVIRVLPPVGDMDYFFQEAGRHYEQKVSCASVSTDGDKECPVCEVYNLLVASGESKSASDFKPGRTFHMNIIVRKEEDAGPKTWTPGPMAFQAVMDIINDPDYGLIYCPYEGMDISLKKEGEGFETKYSALPRRKESAAGTDDQLSEWLGEEVDEDLILWSGGKAKDLLEAVTSGILSYDDCLEKSGVGPYLIEDYEDEPEEDYEDEPEASPSERIRKKMTQRKASSKRGVRRPRSRR